MWFNPAEITKTRSLPIETLATLATLQTKNDHEEAKVAEVSKVATECDLKNLALQKELETFEDQEREVSRQKAIAQLNSSTGTLRGIYVNEAIDPDNVIVFIAFKATQQTCDVAIPRDKYDPFRLLELIDQLGK